MRFNPPPNWPPPPPGWAPDATWAPDPAWPPPPPGWQLWVADDAAPGMPPGYPLDYPSHPQQPPYPAQWPPPGRRPRRLLWVALAAAALVTVLVVGLLMSAAGRLPGQAREEKPSKKPDITELTSEMLVGRSAFPEISGGKWISGVNEAGRAQSSMPNVTIDPPECADLYGDSKAATQTATATLANIEPFGLRSTRVHLAITPDRHNMRDYLQKCQTFTQSFKTDDRTVSTEVRLEELDVADVPPWAVATVMTSSSSAGRRLPLSVTAAAISGYYRGVLVVASSNEVRLRAKDHAAIDPQTADDLVRLFNAEVEKLEQAS